MTAMSGPERASGPVRRADKIAQVLARDILDRIIREDLQPGAHLSAEAQMLEQYQVGRGTLREALRILEVNGLISIKPGPGGGPIVRGATTHDFGRMATLFFSARRITVRELVEARLILEPVTARLAAERRTDADLPLLERLAGVHEPGGEEDYRDASVDFHTTIVRLAGNGVIELFALSLAEVFFARVHGTMLVPEGSGRRDVLKVHGEIARAVADGDAATAEVLMREHMQEYVTFVSASHPALMDEVVIWQS
jgi:GntR family transcriptional regulator, transcriptional repressor for pyruvate dehydrogenase complex